MNSIWTIQNLKRINASGMVVEVDYRCETLYNMAGRKFPIAATTNGTVLLATGSIDDDNYISYTDLEEPTVFGWITGSIDTASIELQNSASCAESVNYQIAFDAAQVVGEGIPW